MIVDKSSEIKSANTKLLSALLEQIYFITKLFYIVSILCIVVLHNFDVVLGIIWLDILYNFFCLYLLKNICKIAPSLFSYRTGIYFLLFQCLS